MANSCRNHPEPSHRLENHVVDMLAAGGKWRNRGRALLRRLQSIRPDELSASELQTVADWNKHKRRKAKKPKPHRVSRPETNWSGDNNPYVETMDWAMGFNDRYDPTDRFVEMLSSNRRYAEVARSALIHMAQQRELEAEHVGMLLIWAQEWKQRQEVRERIRRNQWQPPKRGKDTSTPKGKQQKSAQPKPNRPGHKSRKANKPSQATKIAHARRMLARIDEAGVSHEQLSEGHHRIERHHQRYDFWPTTGSWLKLNSRQRGKGTESLLRAVLR